MSIQITTTRQKVEFSKMVKDYKIRYYNLGPSVLYVDYVDSTGTRTETVPAYGSFTVMSNAGNAANSYLNLYTSSGITNIVVSKIQQDCAVDGTDLFGNVITAVDPADVASLLQKTTNMAASSGVTTFTGTVSAADFAAISSISVGSVELTEESLQEIETNISNLLTSVASVSSKTQNQSGSAGVTNFSGTTNLTNASVSGTLSANGGFQADAGTNFWTINEFGLVERSGEDGLIQMLNGQITCESISPKTINAGSISASISLIVAGTTNLNGGFTYTKSSKTWNLSVDGLSEGSTSSSTKMFSVQNGNIKCVTLTASEGVKFASGTYGIDNAGDATLSQCTVNTLSANGYLHGTTFKGTASGYDYFEISPGVCRLPSGNPASGTYGYNHWVGTQSDYDRIAEKNINTLYYVIQADNSVNIIKGSIVT